MAFAAVWITVPCRPEIRGPIGDSNFPVGAEEILKADVVVGGVPTSAIAWGGPGFAPPGEPGATPAFFFVHDPEFALKEALVQ